jgi:myo-inositol 2-dehydrogenase/D-chiro-inositol 1-dehydrogenase
MHYREITTRPIGRRAFLAGAAATTFTVMHPSRIRASETNSTIKLGLIGCGGRGRWITNLFNKHGKYRWVACADYFQDRVDAIGDPLGINAARRFTTLSGYKRMLETDVDAVVIETPPCFHPEQAAAAIEAGKHVYLAKPIAVDVPGCLSILESGKRATTDKLVFLVDFQTRADKLYREALRRVHAGDIGRLVLVEAHYPWQGGGRGAPPANPEERLRHWYYVLPISGDFIVEQSIHALDVATWVIDADPIRARGTGGRLLRPEGSIWDHFAVIYEFPDDVVLSFTSIQSIPGVQDEIRCRAFGADGVLDTDYFGSVWIRGRKPYPGGTNPNLYSTGTEVNIAEFYERVASGDCTNPTVAPSVRSNLTAVMGRNAAYKRQPITWTEMIQTAEKLEPDLSGLKA